MVAIMQPNATRAEELVFDGTRRGEERRGAKFVPLTYSADWRSVGFILFLSGLFFVQWTGEFRGAALVPVSCVFAFIACIIKHNHIHCPTFRRKKWNRAFDYVLGFCTGQSTSSIIPVHNERHHGHSQSEDDLVRSSVVNFRRNWLNLAAFPFKVVRLVHRNKGQDFERWRREQPARYWELQRERTAILVLMGVLLGLNWRATLIYLGIPWLFGHWAIVTINLLQHQDCEPGSGYDHSRNITGRWSNWLFLNNGFHTAHHLHPEMHWSLLPEFHRLQVAPLMRPELNHRSLFVCVWKQFFNGKRRSVS